METVEIEGEQYEVTGHTADGLPIIQGHATSVHHTDDNGELMYDAEGNPVQSVHISAALVQEPITPGEVA